jgi:hypothetical protein
MNRACYKNATELASSTQLSLHEQKIYASCIRPIKNNSVRMKTISCKIYLLGIMAIIAGCGGYDNIEMFTRIHSDGSCYREFVDNADSAFMVGDTSKSPFPVLIDKNWTVTYSYGTKKSPDNFIGGWPLKSFHLKMDTSHYLHVKVSRNYPSVKEMAKTFSFNHIDWKSKIIQDFNLNKKFRWFYTYYEYNEVFKKIIPNPNTKISDFLTQEEISHYFSENPDFTKGKNGIESLDYLKDLDKKYEKWQVRCIYDAYYDVMISNFRLLPKPNCNVEKFKSFKDTIYNKLNENDLMKDDSSFFASFDKFFKTNSFSKVFYKNDSLSEKFKKTSEQALAYYPGKLNYKLCMPGKIIETNSCQINGDTISWKVNAERFFFNDYTIKATSRKPNYWAFGITGVIVILGLLGFWVRKK